MNSPGDEGWCESAVGSLAFIDEVRSELASNLHIAMSSNPMEVTQVGHGIDLPNSTKFLQRAADVRWMAIEKRCELRGDIALLQYCFADESIAGVYHIPQSALAE